ncbi:MAG: hypothetical protein C0412_15155 [Flavobacterium sp.]|nr:hypothetical protein [Flavobacterium sp.]
MKKKANYVKLTILYEKNLAIGGGEIGRAGFPIETTKIDKEIIKLTNKESPRLLFLPTVSGDSRAYPARHNLQNRYKL